MKKLHYFVLTVAMLHMVSFSSAQFFNEDFSRVKINGNGAPDYEWANYSGSILCPGGYWEVSTDTTYSYGNNPNLYTESFNHPGSVDGFAKLWHTCEESISSAILVSPLIDVRGQAQVMLEYINEFPGVSTAKIEVEYGGGTSVLVTQVGPSTNTYLNTIDITSLVAGHNAVSISFGLYYNGPVGWSDPELSSWCVDDVKLYNPQCNIQAVIKANAANNYICVGDSVELVRTNPVGGTSFQWMLNGANITGATNPNYYATQAGVYSCYITDTCGYVYSNNLVMDTVSALTPSLTNALTFDSVFCTGFYNGGFYISPNAVSNTYQWYQNGSALTGSTNYNLTLVNSLGVGNYFVEVTNACGVYNSDTIQVANGTPTTAVITTGSPFPACYPNQFMLVANDSAGFTHEWYRGNYTTGITNATLLYYPSPFDFKCKVQAPGSCPTYSNIITVPVSPINNYLTLPVTAGGPTRFCMGDSVILSTPFFSGISYQWKKNGINIASATQDSYAAKTTGLYSVRAFDAICDKISNSIQVSVPCITANESWRSTLNINNQTDLQDIFPEDSKSILVYDIMGKLVFNSDYKTSPARFSKLDKGIYYIRIVCSNNKTEAAKLVVQ